MIEPRLSKNILVALLFLVAFTLPFDIKLNTYCIIAFVAYVLATRFTSIRMEILSSLFLCYFLLHLIGMFYTENKADGWALVERSTVYLAFPLLFTACNELKPKDIFAIFVGFILGTILSAAISVWPIAEAADGSSPIYRVYLGMYLVMSLTLIYGILTAVPSPNKWQKATLLLAAATTVLLLVAAQTKMPILIACLFFLWIFFTATVKPVLRTIILLFIALLLLAAAFHPETSARFLEVIQRGDLPRWYNWKAAIELIQENFFAGVGTGDALNALNTKRDINWFEAFKTYNVHNQYLETFLRFGVVGFLVFMLMLLYQIKIAARRKSFFYVSFLVVFSLSILTESMLVRNKGVTFFAFFSGLHYLLLTINERNGQAQFKKREN